MAFRRLLLRSTPLGRCSACKGASMMELLLSSSMFAAVLTGAVMIHSTAMRSYGSANQSLGQQRGLEDDMAMIRDLGERYSWCTGAGTVSPASGGTCASQTPGSASFYVPINTGSGTSAGTELASFSAACAVSSGDSDPLNANLISAINAKPAPSGLRRVVSSDDVAAHRLRISYSADGFSRTLIYTPPVVAWCP